MKYPYKILVATKAKSNFSSVAKHLNKFGYDVTVVNKSIDAIQQLDRRNFDIILLEQTLPDADGLETFHSMKLRNSNGCCPPVIMVTEQNSLNWAMKFMQAQGNDFIELPIDIGLLDSKIRRAIAVSKVYKDFQKEITEAKQEEAKLAETIEELERTCREARSANEAKTEFLLVMSHELRTHLQGILSFATFGVRKYHSESPDTLHRYFKQIEQGSRTLIPLLNDLLDLAKLEAGRMVFQFEPTNMASLGASVIEEFQSLRTERKITIRYTKPEALCVINVDAIRIMQVLRNLISNAIKFSSQGGLVEVELSKHGEALRVFVADNGVGIPESELETIFEKFFQSSNTNSAVGGTGLGLRICREILAAHDGRIWAENNPNGGTKFTFELPANLKSGKREIQISNPPVR